MSQSFLIFRRFILPICQLHSPVRKWKWCPVTTILFSTHDRITQIPISGDFWVMCRFSSNAYLKSLLKCLELNRFSSTNFTFFLTDASNTILLPMSQSSRYIIPGYDAQSSEIIFSGFPNPLHLSSGQELRMWYEEDLKNDLNLIMVEPRVLMFLSSICWHNAEHLAFFCLRFSIFVRLIFKVRIKE